MVALMPNLDGKPLAKVSDKALEALVRRHGARVHPRLVEEVLASPWTSRPPWGCAW